MLSVIQFDYNGEERRKKTVVDRIDKMMRRKWPKHMAMNMEILESFIALPLGVVYVGRRRSKDNYVPPPPPPQVTTEEIFLDSLSGEIVGEVYFPMEESTLMQMIATFEVKSVSVKDQECMSRVGVTWGSNCYFSPPSTSGNEEEIHWYLFSMTLHARST